MGLRTGALWCCAEALRGAAHGVRQGACMGGGGGSPQAFGVSPVEALTRRILMPGLLARCVASGRRLGLRMGADWGCAWAQTGAAQGRRLGLCRGADWGCA